MRKNKAIQLTLIIHSTRTLEGNDIGKNEILIKQLSPVHAGGKGWRRPGYADIIRLDGTLENVLDFNEFSDYDPWGVSEGPEGVKGNLKHIAWVGGYDENEEVKDTRTRAQRKTMAVYIRYCLLRFPALQIRVTDQVKEINSWLKGMRIPYKHLPQLQAIESSQE